MGRLSSGKVNVIQHALNMGMVAENQPDVIDRPAIAKKRIGVQTQVSQQTPYSADGHSESGPVASSGIPIAGSFVSSRGICAHPLP